MPLTSLIIMSLSSFPEELLERILAFSFSSSQSYIRSGPRGAKLTLLLVSRQFHRIARPLLYHTVSIHVPSSASFSASSAQTSGKLPKLLNTLHLRPCPRIHALHIAGLGSSPTSDNQLSELLRLCSPSLTSLDISFHSIASTWQSSTVPDTITQFCASLRECVLLEDMTLRKTNGVYMTIPFIRAFIYQLADVVKLFSHLKSFYLAFRPSDEKDASSGNLLHISPFTSKPAGPLLALTSSLASLPHLQTFITHMPIVWNEVLLGLSEECVGTDTEDGESSEDASSIVPNKMRIILLPSAASPAVGVSPLTSPSPPSHGHANSFGTALFKSLTPSSRPGAPGRAPTIISSTTTHSLTPSSLLTPPRGLYLASARKYPRLWRMIQAGEDYLAQLRESDQLRTNSIPTVSASAAARGRSWTWAAPTSTPSGSRK